ncbi:MAG: CvpA family protein [Candidatus Marinimicrobia bacterium]|jgi:membrane protein required for colicin V production|nr:CvpA family protein [Candidatus Neomarinimicrobiota bacterium]MDP6612359.1 CvpA family protein [Candidatus Neomarinimicrobiota bacterium]
MIDALTIFFIIAMGAIGFRRGLVEELGRLLGIIFATVFALRLYVDLGSFLMAWLPVDVWLLFVLSFIIIFSLVLFLVRLVTKLIHFLFLSKSTKWANRVMGTVFGIAKGLLVVMIFFWMIELLPNRDTADIVMKQSTLAQRLINVRKSIIATFNWKDPVALGEKTIREFLNSMEENNG